MNKQELRRHMRIVRDGIVSHAEQSHIICQRASKMAKAGETAFVYASVGSEVDTGELIRALREKGCRICLPIITGKGQMEAALYLPGEKLVSDRFGNPVPENRVRIDPQEIDVAFVPGLAFTPSGERLGMGGGYYDRFLLRTKALRVALAFEEQMVRTLPVEPWDLVMDVVVTGTGAHNVSR